MKKGVLMRYLLIVFLFLFNQIYSLDLSIGVSGNQRMKILLAVQGEGEELQKLGFILKKDLEFSEQFDVKLRFFKNFNLKKINFSRFLDKDFFLVIFILPGPGYIKWMIYDTMQSKELAINQYNKRGEDINGWAHNIADEIWPYLSGEEGFFTSKIVFCESILKNKKTFKHIYISDFDGSNKQLLVGTYTINLAPRWNSDKNKPLIFYSECSPSNIKIIAVDLKGKKRIVASSDGLNMQANFSFDNNKVIFCSSRTGNSQIYLYEFDPEKKKSRIEQITKNKGSNISPILLKNGDVIFCSDFETGLPQIYYWHKKDNHFERITDSGYCVCPSYTFKKSERIAYTKNIKGVMQLFMCDLSTKKHKQLTFDSYNKEEPSWSPCGNYLIFTINNSGINRLAILNLLTNKLKYISNEQKNITYPYWSRKYDFLPVINY